MSESPAGLKASLRREALSRRDAMPAAERASASTGIVERLAELLIERAVGAVAVTSPIRSEADILPLLGVAAGRGVETGLPAMEGDWLSFRRWRPGDRLAIGAFGVSQPEPDAAVLTPDFIVLPLAAFDRKGNRLGYGKGHFDRALGALIAADARPLLVGAGFAVQEVAAIPAEPHDISLDAVVTERETILI
jgi:5-formyltetrahydrofolate cyclo-ligase